MGAIVLHPGKGKCAACGGAGWRIDEVGRRKACGKCRGTGKALPKKIKKAKKGKVCDKCSGTGEYAYTVKPQATLKVSHKKLYGSEYRQPITTNKSSCPDCGGTGKL